MIEIAFALAVVTQPAQEWVFVTASERDAYGIDRANVRRTGNMRRFWMLKVLGTPLNGATYGVAMEEVDCAEGRNRTLQATYYLPDGRSQRADINPEWRFVVPGTVIESFQEAVCAGPIEGTPVPTIDLFVAVAQRYFAER